jgi:peroxiredoxin Q/BCP
MFKEGTKVNFSLKDSEGNVHKLSDYKGKKVILYFYPKDDTPGCTKEACSFRDNYKSFKDKGIVIFGVSKDDSNSHQKFSSRYNLTFPLLIADSEFLDKWGAFKKGSMFGKTFLGVARITYLSESKT